MIGIRLGFLFKETLACYGRPFHKLEDNNSPTAIKWICGRKFSNQKPRGERKKEERERFSTRFPNQSRCALVLRITSVLNQPFDSCAHTHPLWWDRFRRLLSKSSSVVQPRPANKSPLLERCKYYELFLNFANLICEINRMISNMYNPYW